MPVPYSDNLYSALDDEDDDDYAQSSVQGATSAANPEPGSNVNETGETDPHDEDEALSPADGYFHASDAVAYDPTGRRQSSNVPVVPNVLVEDPTLRDDDRDTKTREAEHERRLSNMAALQQQPSPALSQQSPPASSSRPRHAHRRSIEEEDDLEDIYDNREESPRSPVVVGSPQQQQTGSRPNETSPLFLQQHFDAPPAYTPSPTTHSQPSQQDQTPSSPLSTSSTGAGYQTLGSPPNSAGASIPSMGHPTEHQRLLPHNREPESMGGETGDQPPRTFWQRFKRAFTVTDGRRKLTKVLKWLMITVIVLGILSSLTISGKHHPSEVKDPDNPLPPPKDGTNPDPNPDPQPDPENPPNPDDPHKPSRPPVKGPGDGHSELTWKPRKYCHTPDREFRMQASYGTEFGSSRSISVVQKMIRREDEPSWNHRPNVEGEVILKRTPDSQSHGSVKIEVMMNDKDIETVIGFDSEEQELTVTTPNKVAWKYSLQPCVQMRVTVTAPAGSVLENLLVNTTQLNIDIVKGLDLGVQHEALLHTISGDLNAPVEKASLPEGSKQNDPYLISNRRTIVETVSGNVEGWFALNDLLKVTSVSGDIKLDVAPKAVDPENPLRAELKLATASGDITAIEPIDSGLADDFSASAKKFPGRDYYVDIGTASGSITANLACSSYANIRSQSGDLKLTLWPVLDPSEKSQPSLSTNSKSGDTTLSLLEPFWTGIIKPQDQRLEGPGNDGDQEPEKPQDGDNPWVIIHPHDVISTDDNDKTKRGYNGKPALGNLVSRHGTISGDVRLRYPASWEGNLLAETISGSQHIRGEGLHVYDVGTPLMKTYTGRKGNGSSDLKIVTVSGDENILVGREPL